MTGATNILVWQSESADATFRLGERLGRCVLGGLVVGLVGPLGAGKTQLVKGIAAGNAIGSPQPVTSPTFTLIHEYSGRLPLYHIDVYRLQNPTELCSLGFDELTNEQSVVVVEWADRIAAMMPKDCLWIEFGFTGDHERELRAWATGMVAEEMLERVTNSE